MFETLTNRKLTISLIILNNWALAVSSHSRQTDQTLLRNSTFEPPHEKTNNLHMRKQRRRSASR